jgi:hypothetical protein
MFHIALECRWVQGHLHWRILEGVGPVLQCQPSQLPAMAEDHQMTTGVDLQGVLLHAEEAQGLLL